MEALFTLCASATHNTTAPRHNTIINHHCYRPQAHVWEYTIIITHIPNPIYNDYGKRKMKMEGSSRRQGICMAQEVQCVQVEERVYAWTERARIGKRRREGEGKGNNEFPPISPWIWNKKMKMDVMVDWAFSSSSPHTTTIHHHPPPPLTTTL